MQTDRRIRVVKDRIPRSPERQQDALSPWLPWIMAPLFTLLPIVGCWLANVYQQPRDTTLRQPVVTKPSPSVEAIVTAAQTNERF